MLDDRGWYYRYSHLQSFDPLIQPGATIGMGQKIGVLGKEGGQRRLVSPPLRDRRPPALGPMGDRGGIRLPVGVRRARAATRHRRRRPAPPPGAGRRAGHTGRFALLEPRRARARQEWTLSDGTTAPGPTVQRTYDRAGVYSEILKVADDRGHVAYDFAIVQVLDRGDTGPLPPGINAAFAPTQDIHAGDPVTFKVRTFGTTDGIETWHFGDGTPPVEVRSDGNVEELARDGYAIAIHRFARPGDYLPRVERTDRRGRKATARLYVHVEPAR